MLTARDTWLGPGIDAVAPYADMSAGHPWQNQRFAEYRDTGPGAVVTVSENRPQLTSAQAESATPAAYLGDWAPWRRAESTARQEEVIAGQVGRSGRDKASVSIG